MLITKALKTPYCTGLHCGEGKYFEYCPRNIKFYSSINVRTVEPNSCSIANITKVIRANFSAGQQPRHAKYKFAGFVCHLSL